MSPAARSPWTRLTVLLFVGMAGLVVTLVWLPSEASIERVAPTETAVAVAAEPVVAPRRREVRSAAGETSPAEASSRVEVEGARPRVPPGTPGLVTGQLLFRGEPLAGAIELWSQGRRERIETDANGRFVVDVEPGPISLRPIVGGPFHGLYRNEQRRLEVDPGSVHRLEIDLTVEWVTLEGSVKTEHEVPVTDLRLTLRDELSQLHLSEPTNYQGEFAFEIPGDGRAYVLQFQHAGEYFVYSGLDPDQGPVEIELPSSREIVLRVTDAETGHPLRVFTALPRHEGTRDSEVVGLRFAPFGLEPEGWWKGPVTSDTVELLFAAVDYQPRIVPLPGPFETTLEIALERQVDVVLRLEGGRLPAGVTIYLVESGHHAFVPCRERGDEAPGVPGRDVASSHVWFSPEGLAHPIGLGARRYRLVACPPGTVVEPEVLDLTAGESTDLRVRVTGPGD